jgi:rSAM/selenodomain-associated transferase 2
MEEDAPAGERRFWMKVSVIIPVLNEIECLPQNLAALKQQSQIGEIILVDGGSADGTLEWLRLQCGVMVVQTPVGTGNQLNAGAKSATGDFLLFLHADTRLPGDAYECLEKAFRSKEVAGGCFCVRFDRSKPRSLGIVAAGINLRTRITHSATGDQAIFVRRDVFEKVGGFPEWPLFEDVEFVTRMKRAGRFAVIRVPVTISSRRHVRCGVLRTVLLCYLLRLGFWAGISAFKLAEWYKGGRVRSKLRLALAPDAEADRKVKVTVPLVR